MPYVTKYTRKSQLHKRPIVEYVIHLYVYQAILFPFGNFHNHNANTTSKNANNSE